MSSVTPLLPAALPDPTAARLPGVYESAQKALTECSRIDECKTWADKAAALASYARQAKDDSLRVMSLRIQARAYRRMGELLKQIPRGDADGANLLQNRRDGAVPPVVTRESEATKAGLSERQRKTALRVASIPGSEFEAVTARDAEPPPITRLAEQGTASRGAAVAARTRDGFKAQEALRQFAQFCERNEPGQLARAVNGADAEDMRRLVLTADRWLDRFVANLSAE